MMTACLIAILDLEQNPPSVKGVKIRSWDRGQVSLSSGWGVLAQCSHADQPLCMRALAGIIKDPRLTWTHQWPEVQKFLDAWDGPLPTIQAGNSTVEEP